MNDSIYTIPINEVFEEKCGCPICHMHDILQERCVTYIMGAAMMEPDVRIETNRLGFCGEHFAKMLKQRNRLSLALIIQTHLAEVKKNILNGKNNFFTKNAKAKKVLKLNETCFVCAKIDWALERMIGIMFEQYEKQDEFRALYAEQETLCLLHYQMLCEIAEKRNAKSIMNQFIKISTQLATRYIDHLNDDVAHYCSMYDYRNSGPDADWGNSKDAIERAVWFLTTYKE